jgi:hypothetical protein
MECFIGSHGNGILRQDHYWSPGRSVQYTGPADHPPPPTFLCKIQVTLGVTERHLCSFPGWVAMSSDRPNSFTR